MVPHRPSTTTSSHSTTRIFTRPPTLPATLPTPPPLPVPPRIAPLPSPQPSSHAQQRIFLSYRLFLQCLRTITLLVHLVSLSRPVLQETHSHRIVPQEIPSPPTAPQEILSPPIVPQETHFHPVPLVSPTPPSLLPSIPPNLPTLQPLGYGSSTLRRPPFRLKTLRRMAEVGSRSLCSQSNLLHRLLVSTIRRRMTLSRRDLITPWLHRMKRVKHMRGRQNFVIFLIFFF